MSTAPATPGFSWALPDTTQKSKLKESPKPIVNPLLKASPLAHPTPTTTATPTGVLSPPNARFPFSPVNNTLRQRKPPTSSAKKLPPTSSLTVDGGFLPNESSTTTPPTAPNTLLSWNATTPTTPATTATEPLDEATLKRWVLVYGYTTREQYEWVLHRFESLGRVIQTRGTCRPGMSNWVALEYETQAQAQKALCQANDRMGPDLFVGCCPLTVELVQSLSHWNDAPYTTTRSDSGGWKSAIKSSSGNKMLTEEDVLLMNKDGPQLKDGGRKSFCQMVIEFFFGWN